MGMKSWESGDFWGIYDNPCPPNIKHLLRNHGLVWNLYMPQVIGTIYGVFNIRVMGLYIYILLYILYVYIYIYICVYIYIYREFSCIVVAIGEYILELYFDGFQKPLSIVILMDVDGFCCCH